jgi:hypothetical protein
MTDSSEAFSGDEDGEPVPTVLDARLRRWPRLTAAADAAAPAS